MAKTFTPADNTPAENCTSAEHAPSHPLSVAVLQQHIRDLAKAHDIFIFEAPDLPYDASCAYGPLRLVFMHSVTCEFAYAVALHELGHLSAPNGMTLPRIVCETAAWHWARHTALRWTTEMQSAQDLGLSSHLFGGNVLEVA